MIIIFSGIPGVGKSTIARLLARKLQKLGTVKLFSSDKISGRIYEKIGKIVKENKNKVDFLLIDATFYKRKWQNMVYKLVNSKKALTIYLYCSLETCLKRNKERKPSLPDKVIHILNREMEKPLKPDLSINTDKIRPREAISKILAHPNFLKKNLGGLAKIKNTW